MYAIMGNDGPLVGRLFEHGAAVTERYWQGNTPLIVASTSGDAKVFESLLRRGTDPNAMNDYGESVLDSLVKGEKGDPAKVRLLLAAQRAANPRSVPTPHALMMAVFSGNPEMVSALLEFGSNPNARYALKSGGIPIGFSEAARAVVSSDGTPLMLAAALGHAGAARALLDRGADKALAITFKGQQARALDIARSEGQTLVVALLVLQ